MERRAVVEELVSAIRSRARRPMTFMEVCGTHTMSVARFGLRTLLPPSVRLVSGPGCPVCVTPVGYVDHALALAAVEGVTIATFGDMLRVPGSDGGDSDGTIRSLARARAGGADVRVVYSSLDALRIASSHPEREVIFLGVGFETTAPALAATVIRARDMGLSNFSMLSAAKTIPEAMGVLAGAEDLNLDGFLCPGHVSAILGTEVYEPLAAQHGLACAVAGFEAVEILKGLLSLVSQVADRAPTVENCYAGVVRREGNPGALEILYRVFEPADSIWRGVGLIPGSGLAINRSFEAFDASRKFEVTPPPPVEPEGCRCGEVLKGLMEPPECPLFGKVCTPDHPRGACMVSSEGSCAASYNYRTWEANS